MLIGAFFCEFLARAKAQGGEYFFRPMYNKLEILVLAAGCRARKFGALYSVYERSGGTKNYDFQFP
jgi:hypothetical protein